MIYLISAIVISVLSVMILFMRVSNTYKQTRIERYKKTLLFVGSLLNILKRNEYEIFLVLNQNQSLISAVPDGLTLEEFIREEHNRSVLKHAEFIYKDLLTVIPDEDRKEFVEAWERTK